MKKVRTAGCFIVHDGKFIILHRHPDKSQGNTWGLPAGKVEPGESDRQAVLREIKEETGYHATDEQLEFLGDHIFSFPDIEVTFPTFRITLDQPFAVARSAGEHQAYRWVTAAECYAMPDLIHGLHDLLIRVGYIRPKHS